MQPIFIAGSSIGLELDVKPFMLPDQAFQTLENAYVWRERIKKREGIQLLGRLRRKLTAQNLGNTDGAGNFTGNIVSILGLETTSEIELGSISITIGAQIFIESSPPDGTLTNGASGTGTINYVTGAITINTNPDAPAAAVIISFNYYPGLPVMGIIDREKSDINNEQTIFFDTKYAYVYSSSLPEGFEEYLPASATTWNAQDYNFFWGINYRGSTPDSRLLFVTNNVNDANNPMRYSNNVIWTTFAPAVSATDFMFQALILIPYYGRLVALNVTEGTAIGTAVTIANRCRFSQIGNPIQADSWRSDLFGKGGFIDAPTSEAIVSATFFKNTLIVGFERSTWQLRYVGEYGLPFIWERISSDFGCESTFSSVLFDQGVLQVGNRAITASTAINVSRIDEKIPDIVFTFHNEENGTSRVHGIRDFQKELVYWTYNESQVDNDDSDPLKDVNKFPNRVLVYNYRNNTFAIFRENVTCFGTFQTTKGILWERLDIFWDDPNVNWQDVTDQSLFPSIVSGNQEGYIHQFGYVLPDQESLTISAVDLTTTPIQLTVKNHNLETGEIIFISGMLFTDALGAPLTTNLNNTTYSVSIIDKDTIGLYYWETITEPHGYVSNFTFTPVTTAIYVGGGQIALYPKLDLQTKDFNPYQSIGKQFFLSNIDFLIDATPWSQVTVILNINSSDEVVANVGIGNKNIETSLTPNGLITFASQSNPCVITSNNHGLRNGDHIFIQNIQGMSALNNDDYIVTYINSSTFSIDVDSSGFDPYVGEGMWSQINQAFYVPGSEYSWHRFFATARGQYVNIEITYDDDLMNSVATHAQDFILNAISLQTRQAGKIIF